HKCDNCGVEIKVGDPYKWIAPKSGPYGGTKRYRCSSCPTWQVWEYSSSLSARIAQIEHEANEAFAQAKCIEDLEGARDAAADAIQELADEQREKADNIEDGFGHETQMSEELRQQGDDLEAWADEVREVEADDTDA